MIDLDREDFRLWLASHEGDELVGEWRRHEDDPGDDISIGCPLARWLNARTGERVWFACGHFGGLGGRELESLRAPAWTTAFEDAHDARPRLERQSEGQTTAKEALMILDRVSL